MFVVNPFTPEFMITILVTRKCNVFFVLKKLFCYIDIQQEIYFKSKFKLNGLL